MGETEKWMGECRERRTRLCTILVSCVEFWCLHQHGCFQRHHVLIVVCRFRQCRWWISTSSWLLSWCYRLSLGIGPTVGGDCSGSFWWLLYSRHSRYKKARSSFWHWPLEAAAISRPPPPAKHREGAMHRQNRAIGGAGVGIGEREGSVGGKSWAWKVFMATLLIITKSVKALYLMSQTMTGVGYGDIVPKTERSKVLVFFLIFFVRWIWCYSGGVFFVLIGEGFLRRFRKVVNFFSLSEDRFRVVMAVAAPALCVGVGCIGFHFLGKKSWENAMYLSVVSVTTVGYGEVTVETAGARVFASIWMCLSTVIFLKCQTYLVVRIMRVFRRN
ncbi:two-pore potassium channel 4-like [Pyrus ussuriensis x Pyrus communis]|uniref:Two-pore potassium channel 4-like n=1 Tax=Pyrus ussuriensis x Pyrus communis TaxID=2448454 RepID=A0A5N5GSQ8_9ROSA|nr:two-pore potassium channel 4-like [Pyrus ussuriensis x Pyrus communis]